MYLLSFPKRLIGFSFQVLSILDISDDLVKKVLMFNTEISYACICPVMISHWFQTSTKSLSELEQAVVFMGYLLTTFPGVRKVIFIPKTDLSDTSYCAYFFHDLCFYVSTNLS